MCEHMRDPYLSTVLPGIWKKNSGHKLKYYLLWRSNTLYILQETFQDESYNALFASLFLFFSQSVSSPPIWTCLRQSKRKLLFAKHQLSIWIPKEKIDKMCKWRDPERQEKQRKRSLRQIQSKLALTIYIVRELSIVCVKCYFTLTKKIVTMFWIRLD